MSYGCNAFLFVMYDIVLYQGKIDFHKVQRNSNGKGSETVNIMNFMRHPDLRHLGSVLFVHRLRHPAYLKSKESSYLSVTA